MITNEDEYSTNDLAIAAVIVDHGYPVKDIDRSNPKRVIFIFSDENKTISLLVDGYWQNILLVNPRGYFDTIKHLKSRVYGGA